jgi:hypothetical protein
MIGETMKGRNPKLNQRTVLTELPEELAYNLEEFEQQKSFRATIHEARRQIGEHIGGNLAMESLTDIIYFTIDPDEFINFDPMKWMSSDRKPSIEAAKAVAEVLRFPAEYLTRFYKQ